MSVSDEEAYHRSRRIDQISRSYVLRRARNASMLLRKASRDVHSAPTVLAAQTRLRTSDFAGSGMYV